MKIAKLLWILLFYSLLAGSAPAMDSLTQRPERLGELNSLATALGGDPQVASVAQEKLSAILRDALDSSGFSSPSEYLSDTVNALSSALENIPSRNRAREILTARVEALVDDSSRDSYRKLDLLLQAIAVQNVGLTADSALNEAVERAVEGYGEAIRSLGSGERRRGKEGFTMAFESFLSEGGRGNLWNRKRAEKFFEDSAEKIEKALKSGHERVSLDAAELAASLLSYAGKLKLTGRGERLRKSAVLALSEILEGGAARERAESAESLGRIGGEDALPALKKALSDKDRETAQKAAESIGKITGKKPELPSKTK